MKSIYIIVNIWVILSCTSVIDKSNHYTDFPKVIELKSIVQEIDTAVFRYPFRIRIDKDRVIIMDLHNLDYYYHLFTYPDFKYLSSFGKRGNAPEEMLSAENFRLIDSSLWTLDANKRELREYCFNTNRDSVLLHDRIVLEESLLRPLDLAIFHDSLFIIPDYSGENRLCWTERSGRLKNKTGAIPTNNKEAAKHSKPALAQAWRSFIDYNPDNGVLATVTQLGEVIEIYNIKDTTYTVTKGPFGEPEFRISGGYAVPSGIMGFSDIQITDNYIYAVFHGRTFKELSQQKEHIDGGKFIYVFDLKGKPIIKYVLDSYIYGIFVDEKNGVIWATDVNKDQPILRFNISSI